MVMSETFPRVLKFILAASCCFLIVARSPAVESGQLVVVIYNSAIPESKEVAQHYAAQRTVPTTQVFGFELPATEAMSRKDFRDKLQKPLLEKLTSSQLVTLAPSSKVSRSSTTPATPRSRFNTSKVRYAVLCYGVPTKISKDPDLKEPDMEKFAQEFRRNEASVDADLACLPMVEQDVMLTGAFNNPFFRATNASFLHPTNGILLVTRLDGPSAEIAKGLVNKAMEADTNGLWGRAYIDSRGITNGGYKLGDDWMRLCARITRESGFDTDLDENEKTFSVAHPMSHIAFYVGWYDWHVSGPFARATVEFMPGAFAYHLHSFSANTIRSATENWVGPLLAKGATITLGCVDEPYLGGTPDVATFLARFVGSGFSFGEAAYVGQALLSWQSIAIGDPLYRPFAQSAEAQRADLEQRKSKMLEWFYLRLVNFNYATGMELNDAITFTESIPLLRQSAVLTEKLADLYWAKRRLSDSLDTYEAALKRGPSPQQKVRLMLYLAERRISEQASYDMYQAILKEVPDYADQLTIYRRLLGLAQSLEKTNDIPKWDAEVKRLTPLPPPPPQTENKGS